MVETTGSARSHLGRILAEKGSAAALTNGGHLERDRHTARWRGAYPARHHYRPSLG